MLALTCPPPGKPLLQRNSACVLRLDARQGTDWEALPRAAEQMPASTSQATGVAPCVYPVPRGCLPPGRERCVLQPWGKRPHKRSLGPLGIRGGGVHWPQDTGAQLGRCLVCFRLHVYDSRKVTSKITWYASKVRLWIGHASFPHLTEIAFREPWLWTEGRLHQFVSTSHVAGCSWRWLPRQL